MSLGILVPRLGIKVLLYLSHTAIGFGTESKLDLDEGLEGRIEVRNTQVDELGQLGTELLVQLLVGDPGHILLLFGTRQLSDILVGLFHEALDLGAEGIVIEKFVGPLFDA